MGSHAVIPLLLRFIGPAGAAGAFIGLLRLLDEPLRRKLLLISVAGFSTLYVSGGLGPWELIYVLPASYVAYRAFGSYRFIALGWLMHPAWDLLHHFSGHPLWPWMPGSSLGCAIFDPIVAVWAWTLGRQQLDTPLLSPSDRLQQRGAQ